MKKAIFYILVLISLIIIIVRLVSLDSFFAKPKSGLKITTTPAGAEVFIDQKAVGKTPFVDENLETKQYEIDLKSEGGSWQGQVLLNPGTLTVVNRELATSSAQAAGEVLSLHKGSGASVYSWPSGAEVEVDGKVLGKTPILVNISPGDHTFVLSHSSYLKRSIRALVPNGFNLNLNVDLSLSEADLTIIDSNPISITPKVLVKETPTNFLRVRDKAGLNGREIARVSPGDELILLEELGDWAKVRLSDGTEGFVSASFIEKISQ